LTVVPAAVGTHRFTNTLNASYTAGRDYVKDALLDVLRRTDTLAVDIETFGVGKDSRRIKSVTMGDAHHAVVMDPRDPMQKEIIKLGFSAARFIVLHNSPFDIPSLYLNGLLQMADVNKVIDTIIYARMASPSDIGGHDLFSAGKHYAGLAGEDHLKAAFKMLGMSREKGFEVFDLDRPIYLQGAAADVIITARILPLVRQAAYNQTTLNHPYVNDGVTGAEAWRLVDREQTVNRVFLRRTCKGVVADLEYLDTYRAETAEKRQTAEKELDEYGIKPGDGNSLITWLEDHNQLPDTHPRTEKTDKPSATAKDLELIEHPIAKLFVDQKKIAKIEKDYLLKTVDLSLSIDGIDRVFPVTNVFKAATGRAAMADPPLHQFNGPARGILCADPGDQLVSADWAAIEPCLVANLAGEVAMYTHYETWFADKVNRDTKELGTWGDTYEGIAELAGVTRKVAKVILLAALYGEGIKKLALDLGITVDAAKKLQADIFNGLPNVQRFIDSRKSISKRYASAMTLSGRIIPVPSVVRDGFSEVMAYRGVNYCVSPETKILRSDLRHVPADTVHVGDRLVAFDEYPQEGLGHTPYRKMRTATVEKVSKVTKPSVTVRTADGKATVCSTDHLWLVRPKIRSKKVARTRWVRADELAPDDVLLSVGVWDEDHSRDAGYLAGLYDGEGCLMLNDREVRHAVSLLFSQKPGVTLNKFLKCMDDRDLTYTHFPASPGSTSPCSSVQVSGIRRVMRTLGALQPERFKSRFEQVYEGASITAGLTESVAVVAVEPAGDVELVSIQTDTRTLIANGYLSHNCVQGGAYDILAETIVEAEAQGLGDGIYFSVHDELIMSIDAAYDIRKIMETPPERLCQLSGRTPMLRTDLEVLGKAWKSV
jgi:DNA polymerase-1